jgi:hypothetical protein
MGENTASDLGEIGEEVLTIYLMKKTTYKELYKFLCDD